MGPSYRSLYGGVVNSTRVCRDLCVSVYVHGRTCVCVGACGPRVTLDLTCISDSEMVPGKGHGLRPTRDWISCSTPRVSRVQGLWGMCVDACAHERQHT